jgi:hypothetical protein
MVVQGQGASALGFAGAAVQAWFSALLGFRRLPRGIANRDRRAPGAPVVSRSVSTLTQGRRSYHLRC